VLANGIREKQLADAQQRAHRRVGHALASGGNRNDRVGHLDLYGKPEVLAGRPDHFNQFVWRGPDRRLIMAIGAQCDTVVPCNGRFDNDPIGL
jgi:hypothetical protein